MITTKLKFSVHDNYYKSIDNVFSYVENNNIIKMIESDCLFNFDYINSYNNINVQYQKHIYEELLDATIFNITSKIVRVNKSLKLNDNCWLAIIFLNDVPMNNIVKFISINDNNGDYVLCKQNRLVLFNNNFCDEIVINEKCLLEIIKIEIQKQS